MATVLGLASLHGLAMQTIVGAYRFVPAEAAQTIAGYPALHHTLSMELALVRQQRSWISN